MSSIEMESIPTTRSPPFSSQWVAPPTASWTHEEISMIQDIFLSDEKAIQIRDISISDSKQPVVEDPLVVFVEQSINATSMLLSPIGEDAAYLRKLMVDEKDAQADFFVDANDPFQFVPVGSAIASSAPVSNNGRPSELMLAKLRAKVENLSHIYYTRCMNVLGADETSINKVKLFLAIERLRRVIQGLSLEHDRLTTNTTSFAQRTELRLHNRGDTLEIEQLSQCIHEATCAAAVKEGTDLALTYSMEGEVLMDRQDERGWSYQSVLTRDGAFAYSFKKDYQKEVNMHHVIQRTWAMKIDSESVSRVKYRFIKVQQVKKVGQETVIIYDMTNHDATRIDRMVAVLFRVETPTEVLLGLRSLDVSTPTDTVRRMDCTAWQRYTRKEDGGFSVTAGGLLSVPSRADVNFMAVEIFCLHWRWETSVVGKQLAL